METAVRRILRHSQKQNSYGRCVRVTVMRKCYIICDVCEIIQYLVLSIVHCYSCI